MHQNIGEINYHRLLPEEKTGYAFDWGHSWWSTVVPEQSTNLIVNPSFERVVGLSAADEYNINGDFVNIEYTEFPPVGATAGKQVARLEVSSGIGYIYYYYNSGVTTRAGTNTFSCDVYVTRPDRIILGIYTVADALVAQRSFDVEAPGWQRYSLTFRTDVATVVRPRMTYTNNTVITQYAYTDAWQFEHKGYPTTYLDGDMVAFDDTRPFQSYYWHGVPHGSTSARAATANDGGRVVGWDETAEFMTTGVVGLLGMPIEPRTVRMANGEEMHTGIVLGGRDFSIVGRIFAKNPQELYRRHNALMKLLRPNNTLGNKPVKLRYQQTDARGNTVGRELEILAAYTSGLAGVINDLYQEALPLQFRASQPNLMETFNHSQEINASKLLYSNGIIYRNSDGDYVNLGEGDTDARIQRVGFLRDGSPLAAGNFTRLCGFDVDNVGYWDGDSWVQVGSNPPSPVYDIDTGYRFGYDLLVASSDGVYEYDPGGDSWSRLGGLSGATDDFVTAVARDVNGDVWAAGYFDLLGGVSRQGVAVYRYATDTWETLDEGGIATGDGPANFEDILVTNDGRVFVTGNFYAFDSPDVFALAHRVAMWDDDTGLWQRLSLGTDQSGYSIAEGRDGSVYFTGPFTLSGDDAYSLLGVARWNGNRLDEPFTIQSVDQNITGATRMFVDPDGIIWFMGEVLDANSKFDVSDTIGPVDFFGWRDGVFYPPFASNTDGLWDMDSGPGGELIISTARYYDSLSGLSVATPAQDVRVPAYYEIEYEGTADTPLIVKIRGSSQPVFVENRDTKGGVYFRHTLTLGDNETMTVRNDGKRSLVYSDGRPNLQKFVLSGLTKMSALRLRPGTNRISIFALGPFGSESTEWVEWRDAHWGIGGAVDD